MSPKTLKEEILRLKEKRNAVILAHYYQRPEIQDLADYIGDSLALAQIAARLDNPVIVMCGVYFMGETAKILCPDKTVLIPDPTAGCSLADSCKSSDFKAFIEANPGHTVISYVNTSADVKALTDILVTSSNALKIVESLPEDMPIIFGPDRNLGAYINALTGRAMRLWDGCCHVHDRFSAAKIAELKRQYPDAKILAHPECRPELHAIADKVGSTAGLLKYAQESSADTFIVVTESGILHEMQLKCPGKTFIPAPPQDATHNGCNECEYMKQNTLESLYRCLRDCAPEVTVDDKTADRARRPIERMLALS